jgi:hypothetical protein
MSAGRWRSFGRSSLNFRLKLFPFLCFLCLLERMAAQGEGEARVDGMGIKGGAGAEVGSG